MIIADGIPEELSHISKIPGSMREYG